MGEGERCKLATAVIYVIFLVLVGRGPPDVFRKVADLHTMFGRGGVHGSNYGRVIWQFEYDLGRASLEPTYFILGRLLSS